MYSQNLKKIFLKKKISIGKRIRIRKDENVYSGILMPRISGGKCIVIKLDNGYNIGIRYGKGVGVEKA